MRAALAALYRGFHASIKLSAPLARRSSAPLLISPRLSWTDAAFKILIVGQETNGWECFPVAKSATVSAIRNLTEFSDCGTGVDLMMEAYERFFYDGDPEQRNSAFWRAFRLLNEAVADRKASFLWTNIFKFDMGGSVVEKCSVGERASILEAQRGLLIKEIEILAPDVIIFFSGPTYDAALKGDFPDVEFTPFKTGTSARELALVYSESLKPSCLRSFHPSYLQRSRRWNTMLEICRWLNECECVEASALPVPVIS